MIESVVIGEKGYLIKKRNGEKVRFDSSKIKIAIAKAFLNDNISNEPLFDGLTQEVVAVIKSKYFDEDLVPSVEDIQDIVETVLILNKYAKIAKSYILYRDQHKKLREEKILEDIKGKRLNVTLKDGSLVPFDEEALRDKLARTAFGLTKVSVNDLVEDVSKNVYNGIPIEEINDSIIAGVKTKIEEHYEYSYLSSRILLNSLYEEILGTTIYSTDLGSRYKAHFKNYIQKGIELEMINPELATFDLDLIASALDANKDLLFFYLGIQTVYDRYLLRTREKLKKIFELPQWMWMRVAMGLSLKEKEREKWAVEFYYTLSSMYSVSSTPTLFNSGTLHSQMSSCYLNTVGDSMEGIFKNYADNALLSKWAGGIGTDWTNVRAKGAKIKGTNGVSQGVIPFIKIFNDVALAVNQGGKRKGAFAAYIEPWHLDIDEFLELKKNTGDERRRAHDIHTACFIPDLFMQRVKEDGKWTLFSPDTVPDLHHIYGKVFQERYEYYEAQELLGKKIVKARELWKKILTMLYETGHPWITFKDPINVRSPQDHVGVIHNSNLCTEITLNTSNEETAVCNLASVNLALMVENGKINDNLLEKTVKITVRMLDNVIDNNFYPVPEAENANMKHRPIGLGIMGYQDALYQLEIDFDSEENLKFSDFSMELISYYAILASSELAQEKGPYSSYKGSKWDRGILPYDTLYLLEKERGEKITVDKTSRLDWTPVREHIKRHGMRNSNCMAIAPTATISNISGTTPCIEPIYKNIYMKENLSGNFVVINRYLIDELEKLRLWNKVVLNKIKIHNGSLLNIDEIPASIRRRFKETFEIEASWIIKAAALRGKWIDQSASTNIFLKTTKGKLLSDTYMLAWEQGLKTTYYLRTLSASQVTKTIIEEEIQNPEVTTNAPKVCSILDPDCEACQ